MKELTPAQKAELRHLNRMVDIRQEEVYGRDPDPNGKNKLFYARQELKEFVRKLRQDGYSI